MQDENESERASDRAYRSIRRAVIQGQLNTGRKLTEAGLAQLLNLSRTPVREAVKRLLLEGLLQREKGFGLRCALPTTEEIQEIFALRARLESYAALRAALNATPAQTSELQASAMRMDNLVRQVDSEVVSDDIFARIDLENSHFHSLIVQAAQVRRLPHLLQPTVDAGLVTLTLQHYTPQQRARSVAHHHEITEAITTGHPEWAERAMQAHILAAAASIINR